MIASITVSYKDLLISSHCTVQPQAEKAEACSVRHTESSGLMLIIPAANSIACI